MARSKQQRQLDAIRRRRQARRSWPNEIMDVGPLERAAVVGPCVLCATVDELGTYGGHDVCPACALDRRWTPVLLGYRSAVLRSIGHTGPFSTELAQQMMRDLVPFVSRIGQPAAALLAGRWMREQAQISGGR